MSTFLRQTKFKKGFTLTELLVVLLIVGLISSIAFANYRQGEKQFALQRSAVALSQNIRTAQNMSMGASSYQSFKGYGIYFNLSSPNSYILFADEGDGLYGTGDEEIETFWLEAGISLYSLSPGNPLSVAFFPPDPFTLINSDLNEDYASIVLTHDEGETETVSLNKVGLIEVE